MDTVTLCMCTYPATTAMEHVSFSQTLNSSSIVRPLRPTHTKHTNFNTNIASPSVAYSYASITYIVAVFVPLFRVQYFMRRSKQLRGRILEDHCPKQRRLTAAAAATAATQDAAEQAGCRCCGRGGGAQKETRCVFL